MKDTAMPPFIHPIMLLCLVTAACVASPALQPAGGGWGDASAVSEDAYVLQDAARFGLTGQESLDEAAAIIGSDLAAPPNERGEGNYREDLKTYSAEIIGLPRGAVVMTRENLADDSVQSEQHVIEFAIDKETGAASVTKYGTRVKCWRDRGPTNWTRQLCS